MKKSLLGLLIAGATLAVGHAQAQINLRFADTLSATDTHNVAAHHMSDLLKAKTGGKITMTVHPAGELGNDGAILEGVRLGTIDIALTGNPFFTQFAPRLNVMDLPFLFRDLAHAHKVVDSKIGTELLADLEKNRIKGLAFWEIGFRHITNSKKTILTPDDLKGLKIRTTPNRAHIEAFKIWGANPTPMAFTELYLALKTGAVDAQENPINNIYANRMFEVQKFVSLTAHAYTASIVAMNLSRFNSLSPEHKKAVLESALEAARYQRDLNKREEGENLGKIRAAGLQITEKVDSAAFRQAAYEQVTKSYTDAHGVDIVNRILATR